MSISPLGVIDFLIFLSLSLFIQWDTNGKSASFRTKVIPLCSLLRAAIRFFSKSFNLCIIVISYETSTQGECIGLTKFHAMNNCGCFRSCLLYTSDAADDLLCVDLGGRRIIKKKKKKRRR